jgi:hypothetical protein
VSLPHGHKNDFSTYRIDTRLDEELRSSLGSIFERNEEKLSKLKDVKTLIGCYKRTREYKRQADEQGILSFIINKIIEELLEQAQPYYVGSILKNIEIQTRIKKEDGTVEVSAKIDFDASLKPFVQFTIEIDKKESYAVRFTFQVDTSAHMTKLTFSRSADKGKSIHIEKTGIIIDLSLIQIEFLDLTASSSHISLNKKMKLGSKSFELHDLSLYAKNSKQPIDSTYYSNK